MYLISPGCFHPPITCDSFLFMTRWKMIFPMIFQKLVLIKGRYRYSFLMIPRTLLILISIRPVLQKPEGSISFSDLSSQCNDPGHGSFLIEQGKNRIQIHFSLFNFWFSYFQNFWISELLNVRFFSKNVSFITRKNYESKFLKIPMYWSNSRCYQ